MSKKSPANAAWGGRFAGGPSEIMQRINVSLDIDKRLYAQDIAGSAAHSAMLVRQGIIAKEDGDRIARGLAQIKDEIEAGKFPFKAEHEDIHLNIEARLGELIGPAAGRLHTARSRNDQVATDFRLWVRDAIDRIDGELKALQAALLDRAEEHAATVMPGFTHMQPAQPVTFGHHLMAYVEMLGRDRGRFADARARLNESPLGAAALAGTVVPDRPRRDREGAGLRPADGELDGRGIGPRFRAGIPGGGGDLRHASLALRRGDRAVVGAAIRLHQAERRLHHRQFDHAAKAQSRRGRAGARQGRALHRRSGRVARR